MDVLYYASLLNKKIIKELSGASGCDLFAYSCQNGYFSKVLCVMLLITNYDTFVHKHTRAR